MGPAALNEGIKAIGEAFSPEAAISRQQAVMARKQFEMTMKPITLDDIASKTAPDLWQPMQKLAEANGIVEEHNGVKFIRQGALRQFHDEFSKNKVWQAQILDESTKNIMGQLEQFSKPHAELQKDLEMRKSDWAYRTQQAMEATDAKGNKMPVNVKALDAIRKEQMEYQASDSFKKMQSLEQQMVALKGQHMKRIQALGLIDEGFKKDVQTYGQEEALKISMYGSDYRRQLDRQLKEEKLQDAIALETAKAGLKDTSLEEKKIASQEKIASERNKTTLEAARIRHGNSGGSAPDTNKKDQLRIFNDALKQYDKNITFAKSMLTQSRNNPEQYKAMVESINANQREKAKTLENKKSYLSGGKVAPQTKKQIGTKDGKPVYDLGNGKWQIGD